MMNRLSAFRQTVPVRGLKVYASQQIPSTLPQYAATRKSLIKAIDLAVKKEDYASAALLKKDLEALNTEDPYYALTMQLQECINEQRFQARLSSK
jgi:bacterioferritin (cytochrome b1)